MKLPASKVSVATFSVFFFVALAPGRGGVMLEQNQVIGWYAVHEELNANGQSLNLGDGEQTIPLKAGWSCTVGTTSRRISYEARTTVCRKGAEGFEFTVQCEQARRSDHTQIRFRDEKGPLGEFISIVHDAQATPPAPTGGVTKAPEPSPISFTRRP